jgi:hypothetical protein
MERKVDRRPDLSAWAKVVHTTTRFGKSTAIDSRATGQAHIFRRAHNDCFSSGLLVVKEPVDTA